MATAKTKQKILTVFLELLEKHPYEEVSLQLIAETAKVKLSDLRRSYTSKLALVEAFAESIDAAVLDERDEGMDDQPARDRLFDILMTRIDALADHKGAVRALKTAADEDPGLALEFNRIAIRTQKWMLVAAAIDLSGAKGTVVAQGLVMAFSKVVDTWLDEPDEGMPRTMARLDKELDNGVSFMKRLNRLEGMAKGLRKFIKSASKRGRSRNRARDEDDFTDHTETPMPSEQGA